MTLFRETRTIDQDRKIRGRFPKTRFGFSGVGYTIPLVHWGHIRAR